MFWFFIITVCILLMIYAVLLSLLKIAYLIFGYNKVRGFFGEAIVRIFIGRTNCKKERYVINDLRLATPNGNFAQIDHVVITPIGIFVIETKNYSGRIYGNEQYKDWIQYSGHGYKNYFYSPVRQNETHIKRMYEVLPNQLPIYSVVVFVQGNIENIDSEHVCNLLELRDIINFPKERQIKYEDIIKSYNTLQLYNEK